MLRDTKFYLTNPNFCGKFESELCSGFRTQNRKLKGSGVSGSDCDNSPFRGARPKLTLYSDSPIPRPHSTHFFVPTGFFGSSYRAEPVSGRNCTPGPGRNTVRFGKSAQNTRGYQEMCGMGFRARAIRV